MIAPGGPSGGLHKSGTLLRAASKSEAKANVDRLPEVLRDSWSRFTGKSSNKYQDYYAGHNGSGGYVFKMVKPGDVPGSRAEYVKEVDAFGNTTASYKMTYDNKGRFVHRKDKM